jgi:CDP-glucose 4,6-dehydratase
MLTDIFSGKRVLVTGHTGFKGSWLSLWLNNLGADVTGIALDPKTEGDAYKAMKIHTLCNDLRQDINDYSGVMNVFRKYKPEVVFHLAAQPIVLESFNDPLHTFNTNIIGTANILEACRQTPGVRSVLIVTSDKCYENKESTKGYTEEDTFGGNDPYSASKACAELITRSYRTSFFPEGNPCSIATARAGNVIGGGDWSDFRIVPDSIRSLVAGTPVLIRNPLSIRPWQHVLDPLFGYIRLAGKMILQPGVYNEGWNFGPSDQSFRTVADLVKEIIRCWGQGSSVVSKERNGRPETGILRLDISKARERLDWNPVLSFSESVEMTVDWYREMKFGTGMQQFSLTQLNNYEKKLTCRRENDNT